MRRAASNSSTVDPGSELIVAALRTDETSAELERYVQLLEQRLKNRPDEHSCGACREIRLGSLLPDDAARESRVHGERRGEAQQSHFERRLLRDEPCPAFALVRDGKAVIQHALPGGVETGEGHLVTAAIAFDRGNSLACQGMVDDVSRKIVEVGEAAILARLMLKGDQRGRARRLECPLAERRSVTH